MARLAIGDYYGFNPGLCTVKCDLGQVIHTHCSVIKQNIIWCQHSLWGNRHTVRADTLARERLFVLDWNWNVFFFNFATNPTYDKLHCPGADWPVQPSDWAGGTPRPSRCRSSTETTVECPSSRTSAEPAAGPDCYVQPQFNATSIQQLGKTVSPRFSWQY